MSKVILTQEQANIIETTSLVKLGEWFYKDDRKDTRMYKLFCDFTIEELAKAKLIGYEVEPEFKKGDYVMVKWKNREKEEFYRVVSIDPWGSIQIETLDGVPNASGHENTRHATPSEIAEEKERRWWKKHGRDVWELKVGDVLVDTDGEILEVTDERDDYKGYYLDYCSYSLEIIKNRFIILTFAESRLDVKTNE